MTKRVAVAVLGLVLMTGFASVVQAGTSYTIGDVFVAIGSGQVKEFTPSGTLVQTLNDTTGSTYTAGMAFDNSGNLYVTNFSLGTISQFNNSGTLLNANFITGQTNNESIAVDKAGNFYVGDAGLGAINKYNSTGTFLGSTTAVTQNRGTDWIDLSADQKTMLYTSEGSSIKSVNVSTNTQNADFATGLPGSAAYAFRIIPAGATDAGDVLVADSSNALLLDPTGAIIKTYVLPGNSGADFALNIDPNGTDFWTADLFSGNVWEVNIATGAIDQSWNSGAPDFTGGLVVFGQLTSSGGGGGGGGAPTPEPGTLTLVGGGLLLLGRRLKKALA